MSYFKARCAIWKNCFVVHFALDVASLCNLKSKNHCVVTVTIFKLKL